MRGGERTSGVAPGAGAALRRLVLITGFAVVAMGTAVTPSFAAQHPHIPSLSQEGFNTPCGATTDSRGNLYSVDGGKAKVYLYDPTGALLNEFSASANTSFACDVAVDAFGNVYVASGIPGLAATNVARYKPSEFPPTETTSWEADPTIGGGTGVVVSTSHSVGAIAINPDSGDLYVSEALANEKQRVLFTGLSTAGDMFTLTCPNGEATAEIAYASGATLRANIKAAMEAKCGGAFTTASPNVNITYEGSFAHTDVPPTVCTATVGTGTCEVSEETDGGESNVSVYESNGSLASSGLGEGLIAEADFFGVDVNAETGQIYLADRAHNKAVILNSEGNAVEAEIDGSEAPSGGFTGMLAPTLSIDQSSGHFYVSDIAGHGVVDEFGASGIFLNELSAEPALAEPAPLHSDIAVDNGPVSPNRGTIFVTSSGGLVRAFAAQHPHIPSLSQEGFNTPCGATTDSRGNLYSVDGGKAKVYLYDPTGALLNEFSASANTSFACDVAVDAFGNVYVASGIPGLAATNVARYKPSEFPPTETTSWEADPTIGGGTGVVVSTSHSVGAIAINPDSGDLYVSEALANEKQRVLFTGLSTAGDMFTLTCPNGEATAEIAYASGATLRANIKAAMEAKCGGAFTTASPNVNITYEGSFAHTDVPPTVCTATVGTGTCEVSEETDGGESNVSVYESNGSLASSGLGEGLIAEADFFGVDVNAETGQIYLADRAHNKAVILNSEGNAVEAEIDGSEAPSGGFTGMLAPTLSIDQSSGHFYVSDIAGHGVVDEFGASGIFLNELSAEPALAEPAPLHSDIAVDNGPVSPNRGTIFVTSSGGLVQAFGALAAPSFPVEVDKAGYGDGTVTSSPVGIDCGTICKVEFPEGKEVILTASPEAPAEIAGWSGCDAVSPDKSECTVTADTARFATVTFASPPGLSGEKASHIIASAVLLEGDVNPNGEASTYQFEYLSLADYEANSNSFSGPNEPAQIPTSPAQIGAGGSPISVSEQAEGLDPETAYRFRLTASNGTGEAFGSGGAFVTYGFEADGLPDARAYEQATPLDKNGGNAEGNVQSVKAAAQGAAISFESLAGFPGGEGSQEFPLYLASRSSEGDDGGWRTQGLLPSASAGDRGQVLGWTPDFTHVFDQAGQVSVNSALLDRATSSGRLTEIAPYSNAQPQYTFDGSSVDGSKVFFDANAEAGGLDPESAEPAPNVRNVYARDMAATGGVRLAGVLPDGTVPAGGSQPGAGNTTYLRDFNAVSTAGESLYFTGRNAGKSEGQLYRRLNPTVGETESTCEPDADLACTVHISASEKNDGSGEKGHDAAGTVPALFRFASEDGSSALFTSSEKLTNESNTGPEPPEAPAIARANLNDGSAKDLEFLLAKAQSVDVAGGHIYWTNPGEGEDGEGTISRATLGAAGPEDIESPYIEDLFDPRGVAANSEYVYWTSAGDNSIGRAKIGVAEAEEIEPTLVENAAESADGDVPLGIALDGTNVYWTKFRSGVGLDHRGVGKATLNGSVIERECVVFGGDVPSVAVDSNWIYFPQLGGTILRAPISCGSSTIFVTGIGAAGQVPREVRVDGTYIYWAAEGTDSIGRVQKADGTTEKSFEWIPHAGLVAGGLAVDGTHVYWSANQQVEPNPGNDLYRYTEQPDSEGHHLTDIGVDMSNVNGVEVQGVLGASSDVSYVYYAASGVPDGSIANSPNASGEEAEPVDCQAEPIEDAECNIYLWHLGQTTFVARLAGEDSLNWAIKPVLGSLKSSRVTPDGRTLLFGSKRQLTDYDSAGKTEFYLYRVGGSGLTCVSCVPTGAPPSGNATLGSINNPLLSGANPAAILPRNLSADGNRVFFESVDGLVPGDIDGEGGCPIVGGQQQQYPACRDVYEWEADGVGSCHAGASEEGCLFLLSDGKSSEPSLFGDANVNGKDVLHLHQLPTRASRQRQPDRYLRRTRRRRFGLAEPGCGGSVRVGDL